MPKDIYHSIIYDSEKLNVVFISNEEIARKNLWYNETISILDIHMPIHMD